MIQAESHFSLYIIYYKSFDNLRNILRKKKQGICVYVYVYVVYPCNLNWLMFTETSILIDNIILLLT